MFTSMEVNNGSLACKNSTNMFAVVCFDKDLAKIYAKCGVSGDLQRNN